MIYYGIKYALSSGSIKRFEGRPSVGDPSFIYEGDRWGLQYQIGKTAFENFDDAVNAANAMRDKKIKSLQKQIAKLDRIDFSKSRKEA